jgi:hypothetical protein
LLRVLLWIRLKLFDLVDQAHLILGREHPLHIYRVNH